MQLNSTRKSSKQSWSSLGAGWAGGSCLEPLQCRELQLCPLKILSWSSQRASDISPDYCGSPSQDQTLLGSHVIPSSLFPSCFDKAGERLELISYVKYNLLSMDSCIPGEYLLISSIFSVQTFLKVLKCSLVAVPHFLKHLCH